ncbi:MAG: DNA recombination protein RmuC [bacterium]|nr:DNA recombination protein RmuC [bacterium]
MTIIELTMMTLTLIGVLVAITFLVLAYRKRQNITLEGLGNITKTIDSVKADLHRTIHMLSLSLEQLDLREQTASQQLSEINEVLKATKGMKNVGEIIMDTLISDKLPGDVYKKGYVLEDGTKIDAAIVLESEIIPIDTKFSIETYRRLVKAEKKDEKVLHKKFEKEIKDQIDTVSKYATTFKNIEFALLYIPSENAYYDILTQTELCEYAQTRMVHLASPRTFHYFLGLVLFGIKDRKIKRDLRLMFNVLNGLKHNMSEMGTNIGNLDQQLSLVITSASKVLKNYEELSKNITIIDEKITEGVKEV